MRNEARGTSRTLATRRWRLAVAAVVAITLTACSGDDDGGNPLSTEADDTRPTTTSTTQAPASEEAAVRGHVVELLAAWDRALTPILADAQSVIDDPEHRLRGELAESYTADSPYLRDLGLLLEGETSQDTGVRPGPSGLVQETTLLDINDIVDDDHLSFLFCSYGEGVEAVFSPSTALQRLTERYPRLQTVVALRRADSA